MVVLGSSRMIPYQILQQLSEGSCAPDTLLVLPEVGAALAGSFSSLFSLELGSKP